MIYKNFGIRIKYLRKAKKMTREELSSCANISKTYLGMIERGERPQLSIKVIDDLAHALGISLSDLFQGINESENLDMTNNDAADAAFHKEIFNTCYPYEHSQYPVSSLMKFLLYLPLIPHEDVVEILNRIRGSFVGYELYVLQRINDCIKNIPPSPALSFAQAEEKKLSRSLNAQRLLSNTLTPADEDILAYSDPKEFLAYEQILLKEKEFCDIKRRYEYYLLNK